MISAQIIKCSYACSRLAHAKCAPSNHSLPDSPSGLLVLRPKVGLSLSPSSVRLTGIASSKPSETHTFPYVWLRDSCPCPLCIHPSTRQKLHASSDVPLDVRPAQGEGGIGFVEGGLRVKWSEDTCNNDNVTHESVYPIEFLQQHSTPATRKTFRSLHPIFCTSLFTTHVPRRYHSAHPIWCHFRDGRAHRRNVR